MAQHYDDIIRENMAELLFGLAKHMLGKDIQSNTPLNVSLRETLAREPDFLQVVEVEGKKLILHIEFQSTDDKQMYYRQMIYHVLIRKQEGIELDLEQHVLYLGTKSPDKMRNPKIKDLPPPTYQVHYFGSFPYRDFLFSSTPEMVVFTILCDFQGEDPEKVITLIIKRLTDLCIEELAFGKYIKQLEILAKKRNLQEQVIKIQGTMPFTYNLQEDIRFQQGVEIGVKRGEKRGEERGIKLGEERGIKLGKEQGIKLGEEREQRTRIKKLLLKGFSPDQIVDWMGYEKKLVLEVQSKLPKA